MLAQVSEYKKTKNKKNLGTPSLLVFQTKKVEMYLKMFKMLKKTFH